MKNPVLLIGVPLLGLAACHRPPHTPVVAAPTATPRSSVPTNPCGYDASVPVPDEDVATCLAENGGLPVRDALHVWVDAYPQGWRIYAILEARCQPHPFAAGKYLHVMRDDGRVLMGIIYEYQEDDPPNLDCWTTKP